MDREISALQLCQSVARHRRISIPHCANPRHKVEISRFFALFALSTHASTLGTPFAFRLPSKGFFVPTMRLCAQG